LLGGEQKNHLSAHLETPHGARPEPPGGCGLRNRARK
jgi:hypothetical protein